LLALFKSSQRPLQGGVKAEFLKEANAWFYKNRRIHDEEFVVADVVENTAVKHWAMRWYDEKHKIKKEIQRIQLERDSFERLQKITRKLEQIPGIENGNILRRIMACDMLQREKCMKKACEYTEFSDVRVNYIYIVLIDKILKRALHVRVGSLSCGTETEPAAFTSLESRYEAGIRKIKECETLARAQGMDSLLKSFLTQIEDARERAFKCDFEFEQNILKKRIPPPDESSVPEPPQLLRHGRRVFVFKSNNSAQARRARIILPSHETPNEIVLWSNVLPCRRFSESPGQGSTISFIARDDVSDASARQFLQKILGCTMLPSICSWSKQPLRACNSRDVQFVDFGCAAVEVHSWKLRSFQFRDVIDGIDWHSNYVAATDAGEFIWERKRFRQPFSLPLLDVIFLEDGWKFYRKLKFDFKHLVDSKPLIPFEFKDLKLYLRVVTASVSDKNVYMQLDVDDQGQLRITNLQKQSSVAASNSKVKDSAKGGASKLQKQKKTACTVEIDEFSLVNLLFSDALSNSALKRNFMSFLLNKHGKNFWGKDNTIKLTVIKESCTDGPDEEQGQLQPIDVERNHKIACAHAEFLWLVLEGWQQRARIEIHEHSSISSFYARDSENGAKIQEVDCMDQRKQEISCYYCGSNFVIPVVVREQLQRGSEGKFCCISHANFKEKQTKMQVPIFGMTKPEKNMPRECHDPKRDKNIVAVFQRICELEKLLLLDITVGEKNMVYLSADKRESLQLRMRFHLRRDEYDGDAHLSFFIEGSTELLCGKKQKGRSPSNSWKKNVEVSISFCFQEHFIAKFATTLSTFPDFREVEMPLPNKLKAPLSGFYGRIGKSSEGGTLDAAICSDNEGCKIPSTCMRLFMEPEYYLEYGAAYPVIKFQVTIPRDRASSINEDAAQSGASADDAPSPLSFVATVSSYCIEELWLDDRDCRPDDSNFISASYNTTILALRHFRDILNAESNLNLALFSMARVSERKQNCDDSVSHKIDDDIKHLDLEIKKQQSEFSQRIELLLGVEGISCGSLAACHVSQKNIVSLKLLEAFKFFLNSDNLVRKVCHLAPLRLFLKSFAV
jgi:hypothetical protein